MIFYNQSYVGKICLILALALGLYLAAEMTYKICEVWDNIRQIGNQHDQVDTQVLLH